MNTSLITVAVLQDIRVRACRAGSTQEMLPVIMAALERAEIDVNDVPLGDWKRLLIVAVQASRMAHQPLPSLTDTYASACEVYAQR